jgi:hypothetical protein
VGNDLQWARRPKGAIGLSSSSTLLVAAAVLAALVASAAVFR